MGMVAQQTESWGLCIQFLWSLLDFKSMQINEAQVQHPEEFNKTASPSLLSGPLVKCIKK